MIATGRSNHFLVGLTVLVALMLSMVPEPGWAEGLRPEWVPLVVIFWIASSPDRYGIIFAWLCGFALDLVRDGAIGGQYALAMLLVGYVAVKVSQRFMIYPVWQQAVSVMFFMALFQLVLFIVKGMGGTLYEFGWRFWATCFTSMVVWPIVFIVLTGLRSRFRLA